MTTVTLVYTATVYTPNTQAQVQAAMDVGVLPLDSSFLNTLGANGPTSDVTVASGSNQVTRTLTYDLNAAFVAAFPDAASQASVFFNYFTQALSSGLTTIVVATPPVIT